MFYWVLYIYIYIREPAVDIDFFFSPPDIPGSIQAAVRSLVGATDYVTTVREAMKAGG